VSGISNEIMVRTQGIDIMGFEFAYYCIIAEDKDELLGNRCLKGGDHVLDENTNANNGSISRSGGAGIAIGCGGCPFPCADWGETLVHDSTEGAMGLMVGGHHKAQAISDLPWVQGEIQPGNAKGLKELLFMGKETGLKSFSMGRHWFQVSGRDCDCLVIYAGFRLR